ncbi:MAG: hypothetical protein AAF551_05385, partial [Bacteroidota bacterium]
MTGKQYNEVKSIIVKVSLSLGDINNGIKTSNNQLGKVADSLDRVVKTLEGGFKSISLIGKAGEANKAVAFTVTKPMNDISVTPGAAPATPAPIALPPPKPPSKNITFGAIAKSFEAVEKAIEKVSNVTKRGFGYVQLYQAGWQDALDNTIVGKVPLAARLLGGVMGSSQAAWHKVVGDPLIAAGKGVATAIKKIGGKMKEGYLSFSQLINKNNKKIKKNILGGLGLSLAVGAASLVASVPAA